MSAITAIALLRGINAGKSNRIAMADLRAWLEGAGFADVRTHVQSGNVVFGTDRPIGEVAPVVSDAVRRGSGLEIPVVTRTAQELAAVVAADPHGAVASDPQRYFVVFCSRTPADDVIAAIPHHLVGDERFAAIGRELYTWCPDGMQNSRVMRRQTDARLGVTATARNWNTVTRLHEMATGG